MEKCQFEAAVVGLIRKKEHFARQITDLESEIHDLNTQIDLKTQEKAKLHEKRAEIRSFRGKGEI